jgi:hypothetical protein
MTTVEIKPLSNNLDPSVYDVYNSNNPNAVAENDYDINKINKYIRISTIIKIRNSSGTKRYLKKYVKCTKE